MKIALLFALIAGLCLLSVHAGVSVVEPRELEFSPEDLANGSIEIENFNIFSSTWWLLRKVLRTVKGLNCLIKWVVGIKDSAINFNAGVVGCGVTAGKEVAAVVNANVAIISTCNDIIHLQSNVCSNTEDSDSTKGLSGTCFSKALATIYKLKKQVSNAVKLIKKIPSTGVNASQCVNEQVNTLTSYYTQFPSNIKQCSQLTTK